MVPNGARSRTARSPERREVPNDVKRRSELSAVWDSAQYGTSRSMGLRAVWHFAPFVVHERSRALYFPSFAGSQPEATPLDILNESP
jgi:hypothetical protein